MDASGRRHTRYTVPEGAMRSQKIKEKGLLGGLLGWADCRVRDLSIAGALILTNKKLGIGDQILMKLTPKLGNDLEFAGSVVNCTTDQSSGKYQLGIALAAPSTNTGEHHFLHNLSVAFTQVG